MENVEHLTGEAAATLPYTVALNFCTKLLTFLLNSLLLRLVTNECLGLANVRLLLLYTTVTFISREPFRRALPGGELVHRETKTLNKKNWAIVNTNWLCPVLAVLVGGLMTLVWIFLLEEPPEKFAGAYTTATVLYALSACIEAFGEPANAAANLSANFRLRIKAEGIAVGFKTVLTIGLVWFWSLKSQSCAGCEVYGFAVGQFLSSIIYTVWLWISIYPVMHHSSKRAKEDPNDTWFEPGYLRLSVSFLAHSIIKQLLTEGERYVMTATALLSFAEQGVYDVVMNLGSLVARLIFLPLEDTSYLLFSQIFDRKHEASIADLPSKSTVIMTRTFVASLKASLLVGFGCAVFGWFYSDIVLLGYAGRSFVENSDAVVLLQYFCVYTIFLAANGVTEAFVMAGMSQQDLDMHNFFDIGVSIVYTIAAIFLANRCGSIGFIYANCLNMALRVGHSVHWTDSFYAKSNFTPLRSSLPSVYVVLCLVVAGVLAQLSNNLCATILCRFLSGGVLGVVALIVYYVVERRDLRYIYDMIMHKGQQETDSSDAKEKDKDL